MSDVDVETPLKICFMGPSRTGKTSLINVYEELPFSEDCKPTTDIKSRSMLEWKIRDHDKHRISSVNVWDSPGSRKVPAFKELGGQLCDCHGVAFVLDLTRHSTMLKLEGYWHQVMEANPEAATILIGNKSDDAINREIEYDEAKYLSEKLCCEGYFEVSAKNNTGLKQAMDCLVGASIEVDLTPPPKGPILRSSISSPRNSSKSPRFSPRLSRNLRSKFESFHSTRLDVGQWYLSMGERDSFLHTFRETLRKGITVLLYPHGGGAPDYAKLGLHKSNKRLSWDHVSSSRSILDGLSINDIAEVRPYSESSFTFRQMHIPTASEGSDHLFTLVSSKTSISMAADTPQNCVFLVKGLKLLVEKAVPSQVKRKRGKEPFSEGKLLVLKNIKKKKNDKFRAFKSKLEAGLTVTNITKSINQRELFMFLNGSQTRIIFSRRKKHAITNRSSILESFLLYIHGPDPGIDIDDISEVRPGYSLDSLDSKPPPQPNHEQLALSVIGSERTISILMSNTQERDYYVENLQGLIKAVRASVSVY
mmetsp:Transcript_7199/g.12105  ORF Transcript_7199/g.12105 Transcript_7199/m.12105 type:complete len:535 (+) Transcript_7199:142-1746(+)